MMKTMDDFMRELVVFGIGVVAGGVAALIYRGKIFGWFRSK
jgi:hypothetical protein